MDHKYKNQKRAVATRIQIHCLLSSDDNPFSKDRNESRLLVFGSYTCDPVTSYVTAIITIKLLLKVIDC